VGGGDSNPGGRDAHGQFVRPRHLNHCHDMFVLLLFIVVINITDVAIFLPGWSVAIPIGRQSLAWFATDPSRRYQRLLMMLLVVLLWTYSYYQ
jgi:hypothetical protein